MQSKFEKLNLPLAALAVAQGAIYVWITTLSSAFEYTAPAKQRPILLVVTLLSLCFGLSMLSLWLAIRARQNSDIGLIFSASVAFRIIVLFSVPIQEVDIYRYCWDGAVLRQGVSPFRYSPADVNSASLESKLLPQDLRRLVELRDRDPGIAEVLQRVHFGELTTIYPPVSQIVFAAVDMLTPRGSTAQRRVAVMKIVIVLFDLGVLILLWQMLRLLNRHPGWLIAYGWSPLVLKEFSNSGHLDSIAVFFTLAAIYALLLSIRAHRASSVHRFWWLSGSATLLGLAFGAKLYPIILLPLFVLVVWRRLSLWAACWTALVVVSISTVCLLAMLLGRTHSADDGTLSPPVPALTQEQAPTPPPPAWTDPPPASPPASNSGLATFLSRWEMNDFIFMIIEENVRAPSTQATGNRPAAWFVFVPATLRQSIAAGVARSLGVSEQRAPFVLTRTLTACLFFGLALWLARQAARQNTEGAISQAAFLTIAWFWLLSPTQNPWYWTWALPLIPFVRGKVWLALSGLVMVYYLRFWLLYHFPEAGVLGTSYNGTRFFDFVVVWLEFAPWLVALFVLWLMSPRRAATAEPISAP